MNRIFGSSSSRKPKPTLQDAIASTDTRIGSIEVKIKKLDGELARYKEQMAKLRNGPGKDAVQQRALRTLKQKRMYESQLAQLVQQTFNMESAALTTENLRNTMATVDAMQQANKELKKQYGKIDIDKIENIHFEMEDLLEQANEIQESLARSYAVPDELDEADLEAELDALALEEEETGPSYLADLNKAPDFIDEPPVEVAEVCPGFALASDILVIDVPFLSRHNQRRSSPLEGFFGLRSSPAVLLMILLTRRVATACTCLSVTFIPPYLLFRVDRRGIIRQAITSPSPSRSTRCYHDQVFTRRPLSPKQGCRGEIRASVRRSSRSLVRGQQPHTRPPRNARTVPRLSPQIHSFHHTTHHGIRSSRASRNPHHFTLVTGETTPRHTTLQPRGECQCGISP
ncbi:Snf7-domain-containing protein [Thelephora ganbajun]|uniref:Snf7-domain-containing protein n=1 Tax=Thelephora ganbajun TaxID=370292 RepID=A0ACB6ZND0_THEGA|nr:Snf7-domain-containing protein [Thelephora ganbajun]